MRKVCGLVIGVFLFLVIMVAVGCRLGGNFDNGSTAAAVDTSVVLSGRVALGNDIDTGLLADLRPGLASGADIGLKLPISGLKAQLYFNTQGATFAVALPTPVSASGTFSFTIANTLTNLYVRVSNTSETLVLYSVVDSPSTAVPVSVSERTTAIGVVVLAAANTGRFLRAGDVEAQVSPASLTAILNLIKSGLKDIGTGIKEMEKNPLVTAVAGAITNITGTGTLTSTNTSTSTGTSTITSTGTGTGTSTVTSNSTGTWTITDTGIGTVQIATPSWPTSVLAGTALNSPVLAALAAQYGQTPQISLSNLSTEDLKSAVKAAYAVGIDLSSADPATIGSDRMIQMAVFLGTPIVFENQAALTSFLTSGGLPGWSMADGSNAAAAMAAVLGVGGRSQVAVALPTNVSGFMELYCLGVDPDKPLLSTGTLDIGSGTALPGSASKLLGLSRSVPAGTSPGELIGMIRSVISTSIRRRTSPMANIRAATAAMPSGITKKEFVFKWPEFVWYPRDRGQDFIIQCALRVQMFQGSGGQKKFVRMLVDDADGTAGFLNRGNLVFRDNSDKGYFMAWVQVQLEPAVDWLTLGGISPGYVERGPGGVKTGDEWTSPQYSPAMTNSETSFDVDYVEGGVRKTWTSKETREFRMDEFECRTWPGADWRLRLGLVNGYHDLDSSMKLGNTHRFDMDNWKSLFGASVPYEARSVCSPLTVSRGLDQIGLHPKVQAWYSVPANETRSAVVAMNLNQDVWNVWDELKFLYVDERYRNVYSAGITKKITLDFNKATAKTPLWSSGTYGNPGATREMQDDGNLVIYSSDGSRALWSSGTGGDGTRRNAGATLRMQDDGNLVISKRTRLWSSGTGGNPGAYKKMQSDGNLVIYNRDGKPLWATGTYGNPGAYDKMQGDGNYVIYSKDGKALWSSGTSGHPGAILKMQTDQTVSNGDLVIYGPEEYALWSSNTPGNPGAYDVMQNDGNYVIYSKN